MELLELTQNERRQYIIRVRVPADEFRRAVDAAYQSARSTIAVEGFAPGAADRAAIEAAYGADYFYAPAARDCCMASLAEVVSGHGLEVVGFPEIQSCATDPQGLTYTAVYDAYPRVVPGNYRGISVPRPRPQVTEDEVTALLGSFARKAAQRLPLERPARLGDTVRVDLSGAIDGQPFPGGSGEDFSVALGSHTFLPGLEEGIVGMRAGDTRALPLTFPAEYPGGLGGKQAVFTVTVRAVEQATVPPLDDAFAQTYFQLDTLSALREDVGARMLADKELDADRQWEEALLQAAIDQMECSIPDSMVQKETEELLDQFLRKLEAQNSSLEEYLRSVQVSEAEFQTTAAQTAEAQLRLDLLIRAIREAEGLTLDAAFEQEALPLLAERYGVEPALIRQALTPDALEKELWRLRIVRILQENA